MESLFAIRGAIISAASVVDTAPLLNCWKKRSMVKKRAQPISSTLRRATQIMEFISENQPTRASDIQSALSMTKGSVYHILSSLEALDYVRKEGANYYLTFKLYAMGQTVPMTLDFIEVAQPFMKKLADEEKLNVYLSVPDKLKMVGVSHIKPHGHIQVADDFALTYELYSTASGKLWLATLPHDERSDIYKNLSLERITENTIIDIDRLEEEMIKIVDRGYAYEIMEHSPYINGVAAPVFDHNNKFIASLSAVGPTLVLTSEGIENIGSLVARYAKEISVRLGVDSKE